MFFLGHVQTFWILLFYIPLLTTFSHPLGPLTDALATQYVQTENKHSFGSLRLWGSLGWAVASIGGGIVFSRISIKYIFPTSAVLFLFTLIFLSTRRKKKTFRPHFQASSVKEIFKNRSLLLLCVLIALYGIACSPVNSYLNLYFTALNAGNNIVGYAYAIMATSELPFFIIGNRLLKKWGTERVILVAISIMLIRFVLYGFIPNTYLALAVGALQGISLAFFLVGVVDYLHKLLPPGRHAIAQSLIWGLYIGLGLTSGNLLIGGLLDSIGMVGVMKVFIPVTFACLVYGWWYFKWERALAG
jgi:MFS family permease